MTTIEGGVDRGDRVQTVGQADFTDGHRGEGSAILV